MLRLLKASAEERFDADHERLLALTDKTRQLLRTGAMSRARRGLEDVLDFARRHFAAEERLMKRTRYPGAAAHARAHGLLLGEVTRLLLELRSGSKTAAVETEQFLGAWRGSHNTVDREFHEHLRRDSQPRA